MRKLFGVAGRLGLAAPVVAAALFMNGPTSSPQPVKAEPIHAISLNSGICLGLGIAFGGLDTLIAAEDCTTNRLAPSQMQEYVLCLRGHFVAEEGRHVCQSQATDDNPVDGDLFVETPIHIVPEDFGGLDPFDANQFHPGQPSIIIAFVDDDFPVRFQTDVGQFLDYNLAPSGKDVECNALGLGDIVDTDCDQDPSTPGDGVVALSLDITEEQYEAARGSDGRATVHVDVIQENIGFPIELTAVGIPQEITLTPLFGKSRIQTGASMPTPGGVNRQWADPQDCNFAATTDGVLGAVNSAEKTVIVAKALDDYGNEVVGAFINWHLTKDLGDGAPPFPSGTTSADFGNTDPYNRHHQGGVALPQTPTLDTGALGISFPQFVCGGQEPGKLELTASFFDTPDALVDVDMHEEIVIDVVGPATDMTLTAEPAQIDCNGSNSSKITANLTNAAGEPVANGLDVNFEVLTLGTLTPLKADTADGAASTVVTPLSGAGGLTADGQPKGVTVRAWANGQIHEMQAFDENGDGTVQVNEGVPLEGPHQTWDVIERSILVQCSGGPPPPGTGNAAAGGGAPGTGRIRPPDTGSGPAGEPMGGFAWWSLGAVAAGAAVLAAGAKVARRRS